MTRPDFLRWVVTRLSSGGFAYEYLREGECLPPNAVSLHKTGTDAATAAKLEAARARIEADRAARAPVAAPVQEELVP